MYHTPKYEKTQADKDLLWAIDSWRHEHDLVGSSSILSDSIIEHIGELAHYHHLKATNDFINAVDWVFVGKYAAELIPVIHEHIPIPAPIPAHPPKPSTQTSTSTLPSGAGEPSHTMKAGLGACKEHQCGVCHTSGHDVNNLDHYSQSILTIH